MPISAILKTSIIKNLLLVTTFFLEKQSLYNIANGSKLYWLQCLKPNM